MNKIKFLIAIIICKFNLIKKHLTNSGGTFYPGKKAVDFFPEFLNYASSGIESILVVGTNGKTTTSRLISHMLLRLGKNNFSNRSGANTSTGIITAYGLNCTIFGRKRKKLAIIECDELYLPKIYNLIKPSVVVVTNIADDQKDRLKDAKHIIKLFMKVFYNSQDTIFCINNTNAYANKLANSLGNNVIFYSQHDSVIKVQNNEYVVNNHIIDEYNIENIAAACACIDAMHYSIDAGLASLYNFKLPFGRMENVNIENTSVLLTLIKNSVGANAVITALKKRKQNGVLIFAINNEPQDGLDISWLDLVDYKTLNILFQRIYVYGTCSNITKNKFVGDCEEIKISLIEFIKSSHVPVTILANYTAMMEIRAEFAKFKYVKNFWKE